jgi:uncharacterized protein (TIGR02453 family)
MEFNPGYHFYFHPTEAFVGGGWYGPDKSMLPKIRKLIADNYQELEDILASSKTKKMYPKGLGTFGDSLKTAPRGYPKDHPAVEFLKLKNFVLTSPIQMETQKDLFKSLQDYCEALYPLNKFLSRAHEIEVE